MYELKDILNFKRKVNLAKIALKICLVLVWPIMYLLYAHRDSLVSSYVGDAVLIERGAVLSIVVADGLLDRLIELLDRGSVCLYCPLGMVDLAVHIQSAVWVHRPPLAGEGISEPEVDHAQSRPVIGYLKSIDQMRLRVIPLIDHALSLHPLTVPEPLLPCPCQLVQARYVNKPLLRPLLCIVIV